MVERTRARLLQVRVTDAELAMVVALAEKTGLSQSDIVRQLVRKEHTRVFGEDQPKRKRK
jgi:hypothetical protein